MISLRCLKPSNYPWHALNFLMCTMVIVACSRQEQPVQTVGNMPQEIRVVSLAPALTQMIVDLKAEKLLVAVGENDMAAPQGLPSVGPYPNYDKEAIVSVRPTHVLMMQPQAGVPSHLKQLAKSLGFRLVSYKYPSRLTEVGKILCDYDDALSSGFPSQSQSMAYVLNRHDRGSFLREVLLYGGLAKLNKRIANKTRQRVLMVINTNPVITAIGPDTVHSDLLRFMLNSDNAASASKRTAVEMDREMLLTAKPDVILLLSPNAPALHPVGEDPRLTVLEGMDIPAVTNERIVLIDNPLVLLPSTSLVHIGLAMAKGIFPEMESKLDQILPELEATEEKGQPVDRVSQVGAGKLSDNTP